MISGYQGLREKIFHLSVEPEDEEEILRGSEDPKYPEVDCPGVIVSQSIKVLAFFVKAQPVAHLDLEAVELLQEILLDLGDRVHLAGVVKMSFRGKTQEKA